MNAGSLLRYESTSAQDTPLNIMDHTLSCFQLVLYVIIYLMMKIL